jgi:hypothetical protein
MYAADLTEEYVDFNKGDVTDPTTSIHPGQRVTDEATVDRSTRVLSRRNQSRGRRHHQQARRTSPADFAGPTSSAAESCAHQDPDGNPSIFGFVGEVYEVNTAPLLECIAARHHPGDQSHGARLRRQDLQLQRRCRRRAWRPSL